MSHPVTGYRTPGRLRLRQEQLSKKRAEDDVRHRVLDQNNRYFSGWEAQSQVLDHWSQRKHTGVTPSRPPYARDEVKSPQKPPTETVQKLSQGIRSYLQSLNELEKEALETKDIGLQIVSQITNIRNKSREATELLNAIDVKLRRMNSIRSARDRLLHQLFLVIDKVQVIKLTVDQCFRMIDSPIFCPEEKQDLQSVQKSTQSILRVMVNLNSCRHQDIGLMYSEEADKCFESLVTQWQEEDEMCQQVLEKVFETIESILVEKLEANADQEEDILESRKMTVEQLISFISSLKIDQSVWNSIGTDMLRTISSEDNVSTSLTPKIGGRK